jgi:hypothetical protein
MDVDAAGHVVRSRYTPGFSLLNSYESEISEMKSAARIGFVLLSFALGFPARADWTQEDQSQCRATGLFVNHWYGFSVPIPEGLHGCPNSPVEMSDHGVIIPFLENEKDRYIECWAAYNSMFYKTAAEPAAADAQAVSERAVATSLVVVRKAKAHLGDLPAVRTLTRYIDKRTGVKMVRDVTLALRRMTKTDPLPSHEYSVIMVVPAAQYAHDAKILDKLLAKWAATKAAMP